MSPAITRAPRERHRDAVALPMPEELPGKFVNQFGRVWIRMICCRSLVVSRYRL